MSDITIPSLTVDSTTLKLYNGWHPGDALPLLIDLHPYGATPASVLTRHGLDRAHNFDSGAIVYAPQATLLDGANRYWNYWDLSAGDFARIEGAVGTIGSRFNVSRVYLVGDSNGGKMAQQLAIHRPDLFHALVMFESAGGIHDPTAATGTPLPTLVVVNLADTTVNPAGDATASSLPGVLAGHGGVDWGFGANGGYASAAATAAAAASRNGVSGSLGSPSAPFDLWTTGTPAGAGAESVRKDYSNTTSNNMVSVIEGTDVTHGPSTSAKRGSNPIWTWLLANYRGAP